MADMTEMQWKRIYVTTILYNCGEERKMLPIFIWRQWFVPSGTLYLPRHPRIFTLAHNQQRIWRNAPTSPDLRTPNFIFVIQYFWQVFHCLCVACGCQRGHPSALLHEDNRVPGFAINSSASGTQTQRHLMNIYWILIIMIATDTIDYILITIFTAHTIGS